MEPNHYTKDMYYNNPEDIGKIVALFISLHDDSIGSSVRLEQTWDELGLDDFGKMDIMHSLEQEFDFEFNEHEIERFRIVGDVVEHLSKTFIFIRLNNIQSDFNKKALVYYFIDGFRII